MKNVLETLSEIFRIVLDLPDNAAVEAIRRLTEDRWDSLAHASIVAAIESEFGLALDTADVERLTSFAAAKLLVEEKQG